MKKLDKVAAIYLMISGLLATFFLVDVVFERNHKGNISGFLLYIILSTISAASVLSGGLLLSRPKKAYLLGALFQAIQIPAFSVSGIKYLFYSGISLYAGVYLSEKVRAISVNPSIGCLSVLNLQRENSRSASIWLNLVALGLMVLFSQALSTF